MMPSVRRRMVYFVLLAVTITLGLLSRSTAEWAPQLFRTYGGDVLWAAAIYWAFSFLAPGSAPLRRALATASVCIFAEVIHVVAPDFATWINASKIGALLIGYGFSWSDFACYGLGLILALGLDRSSQQASFLRK